MQQALHNSRQVVGQGHGGKPKAHNNAHNFGRSQFSNHRKSDGGDAKLAKGVEHVDPHKPHGANELLATGCKARERHYDKTHRQQNQAKAKFNGRRGIHVAHGQGDPKRAKEGRKNEDCQGVHTLKEGGGNLVTKYASVDFFCCKEIKGSASLLKSAPKEDVGNHKN